MSKIRLSYSREPRNTTSKTTMGPITDQSVKVFKYGNILKVLMVQTCSLMNDALYCRKRNINC